MYSLEMSYDLGFAELVTATGITEYDELGQRDQTDLLLDFELGYEEFPSFTAFTRDVQKDESFTQEIRLVSTTDGPLSWIVGGFYNKFDLFSTSEEFTPGLPEFLGVIRPDNLEYFSIADQSVRFDAEYTLVGSSGAGYDLSDGSGVIETEVVYTVFVP